MGEVIVVIAVAGVAVTVVAVEAPAVIVALSGVLAAVNLAVCVSTSDGHS